MENESDLTLKPDYYADGAILRITESFKDDFYALSAARAKILFNLGLPIYELTSDERKNRITYTADITEYRSYGIFKDVWEVFLHTERGEDFVQIWSFVSNIAQSLKCDMMINIENGSAVSSEYELIYADESSCIENYFDEKEDDEKPITTGDIQTKVKKYLVPLIFEYAGRLYEMFCEARVRVMRQEIIIRFLATAFNDLCSYIDG